MFSTRKHAFAARAAGIAGRRRVGPRPRDAPIGQASGPDPHHVLLVGSGAAVGWGVTTHDLAIPGHLARALAKLTGRGSVVQVKAAEAAEVEATRQSLRLIDLRRYDAVVVTVGLGAAARVLGARRWRARMDALVRDLDGATLPLVPIVLTGMQPARSSPAPWARRARQLNSVTRDACAITDRASYVQLTAPAYGLTERRINSDTYEAWAQVLAVQLALDLPDPSELDIDPGRGLDETRRTKQDEAARQRSLDALGLVGTEPEERFDRIVRFARHAFGTEYAAFTLIDGDRQWHKSKVGSDASEMPRASSFCDVTIQGSAALIAGDVRSDPRLAHKVTDQSKIRFYAGYPITSPDGYRVGSLCVFDPAVRNTDEVDEVLLRDLGMLIQRELWTTQRGRAPKLKP